MEQYIIQVLTLARKLAEPLFECYTFIIFFAPDMTKMQISKTPPPPSKCQWRATLLIIITIHMHFYCASLVGY